jgi:membrane-associated protease RseP (regulator of RpoE activity)
VVVGAHYDHLGRAGDAVYFGADDNASGTAVVLGLARAMAAGPRPPRTVVVALFSGEELGLLGSRHYVQGLGEDVGRVVAMLNFDMVGRLGDRPLRVGGVASGTRLREIVEAAARAVPVEVELRGRPFAPSDHARFYAAGVPVLFFHTGTHEDYHRPTDTPEKIDAVGMARVAAVAAGVLERLASAPRPRYVKVDRPPPATAGRPGDAFLGVVSHGPESGDGVRIAGVMPGTAAARIGLAEGDVIVRFGDAPVDTFRQLIDAIRRRRPGERVDVVYLRDGAPRAGSETLGAHPARPPDE